MWRSTLFCFLLISPPGGWKWTLSLIIDPFPYRVSHSANIQPEEVRRVEVVVVSSDLEKVGLLAPHRVEVSVVTDPLLRVNALLVVPLLLGEHVVHLGLIYFNREDMCRVLDWSEDL